MRILIYAMVALATVIMTALIAPMARAQTANDVNRLNAAIQICNSPMGAGMAECARLRGQLGGRAAPGMGGVGGAGGAAGLLGAALGAVGSARSPAPAAPAPMVNGAAIQQQVGDCVKNAAGDTAMVQACLAMARQAPAPSAPARPNFGIATYAAPQAPAYAGGAPDAATATYNAAGSYQACVAASGGNWQPCMKHFTPGR